MSSTPPPPSPSSYSSPRQSPLGPGPDSDESDIEQLSFSYSDDGKGNIVRFARGSGPSPPSAVEIGERADGRAKLTADVNQEQSPVEVDIRIARTSGPSPASAGIDKQLDHLKLDFPVQTSNTQHHAETTTNPNSPVTRRASLSRSESAYPVLNGPQTATSERDRERAPRSFQRVASGPILSGPSSSGAGASGSNLPNRARVAADPQNRAQQKKNAEELREKLLTSEYYRSYSHLEEKENLRGSDEISSVGELYGSRHSGSSLGVSATSAAPQQARLPPPPRAYGSYSLSSTSRPLGQAPINSSRSSSSRLLKGTGTKYAAERITEFGVTPESEGEDGTYRDSGYGTASRPTSYHEMKGDTDIDEFDPPQSTLSSLARPIQSSVSLNVVPLNTSSNNRPRRSASLSESRNQEDQLQAPQRQSHAGRPGTSLGLRREAPVILARKSLDEPEPEYDQEYQPQSRHSPSPTHAAPSRVVPARPAYGHKRRDSDTLRSVPTSQSTVVPSTYSSTAVDGAVPPHLSPSARGPDCA
ncbi:hypothetical protein L218DRAFT_690299 [Marasmius fiardii PR-910]|nr:hypothetical protein L218DRAFT_690299 [Marasmius fiardii PR-910]